MILTVEDILPMNKGTQAYTEYSMDDRVIDYMMDNETMEKGWKMGHIHSHNTMAVFFSGTDWSELEDNAPHHNFYLSLIVNNFMDFCAKVCFISEAKDTKDFDFLAKDENGDEYVYLSKPYEVKQKKLVVYDCDIKSPISAIAIEDSFKTKVTGIITDAETKAAALAAARAANPPTTGYAGWDGGHRGVIQDSKGHMGKVIKLDPPHRPEIKRWPEFVTPPATKDSKYDAQVLEDQIEDFAMYVLLTGNELETFADLEDICEHYAKYKVSHDFICSEVMTKYFDLYSKFFKDELKAEDEMTAFIVNTELVIDEYRHESKMSDSDDVAGLLTKVADGLDKILSTFKTL
jgi:hypothetical protein